LSSGARLDGSESQALSGPDDGGRVESEGKLRETRADWKDEGRSIEGGEVFAGLRKRDNAVRIWVWSWSGGSGRARGCRSSCCLRRETTCA
jgi:hypothetical protein